MKRGQNVLEYSTGYHDRKAVKKQVKNQFVNQNVAQMQQKSKFSVLNFFIGPT